MEEKMKCVSLVLSGQYTVKELAEQFNVSRKTIHKWVKRYQQEGMSGLAEYSRAPKKQALRTDPKVERLIVRQRRQHRTWGPKKLREVLHSDHGIAVPPAPSTIACVLKRNGLVKTRQRRARGNSWEHTELTEPEHNNHVWAADYKGWFRTGDGQRCDPLTVTDLHSRFLICARIVPQATQQWTQKAFEAMFSIYGLPQIMRVDNGPPFASMGPGGLSKLSVWWITLGIEVEFIRPGKPQDNGRHERMHRTMNQDACSPPSATWNGQKQRLERWRNCFNCQRPHESLGMRRPSEVYQASDRRMDGNIKWPTCGPNDELKHVSSSGHISWKGANWAVGEAFANVHVALREGPRPDWPSVWFGEIELGVLADCPFRRLQPTASAAGRGKKP